MELQARVAEIKEILSDIQECINKINCSNVSDKAVQLKKINATINELNKSNIPVPQELTNLKLSLVYEIDKVRESDKAKKELLEYLSAYVSELKESQDDKSNKKTKKVKKAPDRVTLIDLINAEVIPHSIDFFAYYKGNRITSFLTEGGNLEMVLKGKKKTFDSPRLAAIAVTGYSIDAWKFWQLDFEGKPKNLEFYKRKYKKLNFKKKEHVPSE